MIKYACQFDSNEDDQKTNIEIEKEVDILIKKFIELSNADGQEEKK